jgi:hypothetical protein
MKKIEKQQIALILLVVLFCQTWVLRILRWHASNYGVSNRVGRSEAR